MVTPASGTISLFNVNQEIGNGTNQISLDWVRGNTKDGQTSLGGIYSRAWYQKNNAGNCNNGNCTQNVNCNCGDLNCYNCYNVACVNCVNCDGRAWLQPNCNCACTYVCYAGAYSFNCNCACACDCGSQCFPAGALVLMWDGTWQRIETIQAGDFVMGADGSKALVTGLHINTLGHRKMLSFVEHPQHRWTDDHLHWVRKDGKEWWWSANRMNWLAQQARGYGELKDNESIWSGSDVEFAFLGGFTNRTPFEVSYDSDTPVFLPITAGIPIIVNGYVVEARVDEQSFDYASFKWNKDNINL